MDFICTAHVDFGYCWVQGQCLLLHDSSKFNVFGNSFWLVTDLEVCLPYCDLVVAAMNDSYVL